MALLINELSKSYTDKLQKRLILDSLDLEIKTGEFVSIIGPSGCGKSTLCNLIAGVEHPDQGEILLDNTAIHGIPGNVGYMPQKDLLLPWRTLLENVTLGSEIRRLDKRRTLKEARKWLQLFGLADFANHYPQQLSGGMRQRGALLRTMLFGQNVLLLDEPFGALDALTRREMQQWLLSIWQQTNHTVLFITHDIEEAILLSDQVIVLSQRPAHILEKIRVPFSRPRKPDLLLSKEGLEIKRNLLNFLLSSNA